AGMQSLAREHYPGLHELLVELAHLLEDLLAGQNAGLRLLAGLDDHHEAHPWISFLGCDFVDIACTRNKHRSATGTQRTGGRPSSSSTGRTSTAPFLAPGILPAISIASSRFAASIRKKPPSCSRVSANGPSVTWRFPCRTRTLVAVATGCKGE